jgi:hypothetical protein
LVVVLYEYGHVPNRGDAGIGCADLCMCSLLSKLRDGKRIQKTEPLIS